MKGEMLRKNYFRMKGRKVYGPDRAAAILMVTLLIICMFLTDAASVFAEGETGGTETAAPVQEEPAPEKTYKEAVITLEKDTFAYNGQAKEPAVIVKTADGDEVPSGCYEVDYKDNIDAGTATAEVKFNANAEDYGIKGTQTVSFRIERCSLTKKNTVLKSKVAYNGKKKKVKFYFYDEVTEEKIPLKEGTDFKIKVAGKKKLKALGLYTIRFTGKGNFKSYVRYKFAITPKAVRSLKEKSHTSDAITITWKAPKSCDVTGYYVCYTNDKGKYVKKKTAKLEYTVPCNEAFYVSADVYSYTLSGKKAIKSAAAKTFYAGLKPYGTPVFTLKEGWDSFKITPKREGDYQIYVSYTKGFDNGTVKDRKWYFNGENPYVWIVDSSEHGKTWWVKLRKYTEVDGDIKMGGFSEPVRVTVY